MARSKQGKALLVLTTVDREAKAMEIAKKLVEERVAGCVTVTGRSVSFYYWENKLCQEKEQLLLIKTMSQKWKACEKLLKELHPYSVPEIIALEIKEGHAPYLQWLLQETEVKQ